MPSEDEASSSALLKTLDLNNSDNDDEGNPKPLPKRFCRKWSLNDIDIGKKLGEGAFGSVYLAREKESRFVIALKMLLKSEMTTPERVQQIQREIEIQSHLKHPCIVKLFTYFYDRKRIYLMLEYVPKGELSKDLARFHHFGYARTATYVYQLSSALAYCHQNDVIHRDIKPENILLGARGETKVTDFGNAIHRPASRRNAPFGTLDYLAPEVINPESSYEHSVDTWSLGVLMFEMLIGNVPFVGQTLKEIADNIQFADIVIPETLDSKCCDLIKAMLQKNPNLRMPLSDAPNHPWMREHAEFSLNRCSAALSDWQNAVQQNESSSFSSFLFSDPSTSEMSSIIGGSTNVSLN